MFDIHATLNGTTWDIGEDLQDNATRAEAEESAQIWLDRLTAAERNSATVEIVEIAELNPDPADDVTGNGIECHYDLARQLEMRGYTVDADSEDNEHSYVRFADEHVGDIHGDAVATVTTKGTKTMNDQIKQAIARSISHNEIVSVAIDGSIDDAIAAIESLIDSDTTETDHVLIDGNRLDVWAAEIQTSEGIVRDTMTGEMLWRLAITCE